MVGMTPRTRLSPEERREQLLDLGLTLFAHSSLEEISIDRLAATAGISRGLLYHYFGDKLGFREAVVRRAAGDLVAATTPPPTGAPETRLLASVSAYVDWVDANHEGYLSLLRGAASDPVLREVYDEARTAITERVLAEAPDTIPDTPAARLLVRGWQKSAEEMVLAWKAGGTGLERADVLDLMVSSLLALATVLPG
jgi:AcrR family transcriptional regulator